MEKTSVCAMGKWRKIKCAAGLGILISFCYTAGKTLDLEDSLNLADIRFYLKWAAGTAICAILLFLLWELADKVRNMPGCFSGKIRFFPPWWACVLILLLSWLPAWFSLFPGVFSYDAFEEWRQVHDGMITAHHPVFHVLWLGGLVEGLHHLTGSYNAGIAVYTFMQMLLMAGILTYTLHFMEKFHAPCILQWFALLFYGLSPVMQLFAVCATKDVLFSGVQLLFLLDLIWICCKGDDFFQSRKACICFCLITFFSAILRNNGLYIVVCTFLVLIWKRKKYRKKLLLILSGAALFYAVYVGPVYGLLQVTAGGVEEMLSVPIQQMARVHRYNYDSLAPQDLELLYQILPKEDLDNYRSTVSDFVKKGFQREAFSAHKWEMMKLWIKWGMAHPLTYINSFLINTVDFWYPHAVVDGYKDVYGRSSYFDYKVDQPGTEVILLPRFHEYYAGISFEKEVQQTPFAFLLLSPGWYLVATLVILGYLWRCRQGTYAVLGMFFAMSIATVLLGPIALVRYVLIFYYAFPVMLSVFLSPGPLFPDAGTPLH